LNNVEAHRRAFFKPHSPSELSEYSFLAQDFLLVERVDDISEHCFLQEFHIRGYELLHHRDKLYLELSHTLSKKFVAFDTYVRREVRFCWALRVKSLHARARSTLRLRLDTYMSRHMKK